MVENLQSPEPKPAKSDWSAIKAIWHRRITIPAEFSKKNAGEMRAYTFGLSGVGILLISALITTNGRGEPTWLALAAFVFSVPLLIAVGFMFDFMFAQSPTSISVRAVAKPFFFWALGVVIFVFGLACLLWSYDATIGIIFILAIIFAHRVWSRYMAVKKTESEQASTPEAPAVTPPTST
jgi:hypothetical protein